MAKGKHHSVRTEHLACRTFQHAWDFTTVHRSGRFYVQGLRCIRCGTERDVKIDGTTGLPAGNAYHYADNYLIPGGLTQRERAQCRLQWCRGLRIVEDAS